jgi:glycyl-tRNA synthetase beta chain
MSELLLELFSEEIPARMQARAAEDLKRLATERLTASGLSFTRAEVFVTPRRLALVVDGLPARTPDLKEEKKGPRVGSPDQAIQGFLKGAGLASLDTCEKRMVGKAEFWFAIVEKKGQATRDVIFTLVRDVIEGVQWPKSMKWGSSKIRWVRPITSAICIFDSEPVEQFIFTDEHGRFQISGRQLIAAEELQRLDAGLLPNVIRVSNSTQGHRFLAPARFAVTNFADYQAKLLAAKVMLDPAQRRAKILADLQAQAKAAGLSLRDDPGLLDEVTGLVEWPVVLTGEIDAKFMDVPQEALITSMRAHQKYFALLNADGSLARRFALVANMETDDAGATIVAGNERVLRARLSDAKFFWDLDRKTKLADRLPALAQRVFHAKLGTMAQKVERLEKLSAFIATKLGADAAAASRAAKLAKADLSSGMVGEFPELQGIMGRYYARHDGETAEIADAIRAHYQPLGPSDACPSAPVSVAVALAEKLDTLAGFWSIDEKPTGSKDPFALRRAALGVIRLIVENKLRLGLRAVFDAAFAAYGAAKPELSADLMHFFADRLKVVLKEKGVRHDLIDAVFALGGEDDLVRLLARVEALDAFLKGQDGANLLIGYRRAANIVAIETKKDGAAQTGAADPALFAQAEENALFARLGEVGTKLDAALKGEDFAAAMLALATLRGPVDAFFEKVTVNAEDRALRANRLKLLSAIGAAPARVADFSKIEG